MPCSHNQKRCPISLWRFYTWIEIKHICQVCRKSFINGSGCGGKYYLWKVLCVGEGVHLLHILYTAQNKKRSLRKKHVFVRITNDKKSVSDRGRLIEPINGVYFPIHGHIHDVVCVRVRRLPIQSTARGPWQHVSPSTVPHSSGIWSARLVLPFDPAVRKVGGLNHLRHMTAPPAPPPLGWTGWRGGGGYQGRYWREEKK